jgi:hypothetical protein
MRAPAINNQVRGVDSVALARALRACGPCVTGLPTQAGYSLLRVVRLRGAVSKALFVPETDGVDGFWNVAADKASSLSPLETRPHPASAKPLTIASENRHSF